MKIVIAGGTRISRPAARRRARRRRPRRRHPHPRRRPARAARHGRARSPGRPTAQPARGPPRSTAPAPSSTSPANRSPAGAGRAAQKQRILDSRVRATRSLVAAIARRGHAAAGVRQRIGGRLLRSARRRDRHRGHAARHAIFSRSVCVQWEAEAMRAASDRTRVVCIRTGLVLERDGGALPQMLPPFRFGAGGPVGSGRQYWPWIHRARLDRAGALGDPTRQRSPARSTRPRRTR